MKKLKKYIGFIKQIFESIYKSKMGPILFLRERHALKKSDNFDPEFYLKAHNDFDELKRLPYLHYILFGKYEARPASANYVNHFSEFTRYRYRLKQSKKAALKKTSQLKHVPILSILMYVDETVAPAAFKASAESLFKQWYNHYELCIALGESVNMDILADIENKRKRIGSVIKDAKGIRDAFLASKGDYCVLMRAGDTLTVDALYACVVDINQNDADLIYSDEDKICEKGYCDPYYKTDFSYEMLLSNNYIGYFSVFKKEAVKDIDNPLDVQLGAAAQYDLYLKLVERKANISHIAKILYHKRIGGEVLDKNNTILQCTDQVYPTAVKNHLERIGRNASVKPGPINGSYQVRYKINGNPLVSIVIPFKDKITYVAQCIKSILEKTEYENFEIIAVSNNSEAQETAKEIEKIKAWDKRISFYEYNIPFNYSKINNYAAEHFAKGDYLLLLNNDIVVLSSGWLQGLLSFAVLDDVGAVGAKLCYPNDTVQSAGVGLGIRNYIGEFHKFFPRDSDGYFGRLKIDQNISGLSAACLMVEKEKYHAVSGFDEINFAVSLNDLDFCFRLIKKGYRNVLCPSIELYHYESLSRTRVLGELEMREKARLSERYQEWIARGDPYFNPNFDQRLENFSLKR